MPKPQGREITAWVTAAVAVAGLGASLANDRQNFLVEQARTELRLQQHDQALEAIRQTQEKMAITLDKLADVQFQIEAISERVKRIEGKH